MCFSELKNNFDAWKVARVQMSVELVRRPGRNSFSGAREHFAAAHGEKDQRCGAGCWPGVAFRGVRRDLRSQRYRWSGSQEYGPPHDRFCRNVANYFLRRLTLSLRLFCHAVSKPGELQMFKRKIGNSGSDISLCENLWLGYPVRSFSGFPKVQL